MVIVRVAVSGDAPSVKVAGRIFAAALVGSPETAKVTVEFSGAPWGVITNEYEAV